MPLSVARVLLHPPKRYALSFDGENDYVEIPYDASLDPDRLTVECWVKAEVTITHYAPWFDQMDTDTPAGYFLREMEDAKGISFGVVIGGSWYDLRVATTLTDGWHQVVGTFDESELKAYKDGAFLDSLSAVGSRDKSTINFSIGRRGYHADRYYKGSIALVRVYSRALSAAEIQHNYLNPMSPVLDGLVLWLKMEEGSGTTVHDYSGYGNDGTIYGASWIEITHDPVRTLSPVRVLSTVR